MRLHRVVPVVVVVSMLGCEGDFEGDSTATERSWAVDRPPTLIIDALGGGIWVRRGKANEVKAIITRHSLCKNKSHAFAEDALRFIDVEMSNEGEIIRIVSRRTDNEATGCGLTTSIEVYVPDDARLDLKTDVGSIWVEGSPRGVKAANTMGATGFQLELPNRKRSGEPETIKLQGWGGRVEIELGPKGYEFTGAAPVDRIL
jgi:hypothetical protein